jgi:hypothetical protein
VIAAGLGFTLAGVLKLILVDSAKNVTLEASAAGASASVRFDF